MSATMLSLSQPKDAPTANEVIDRLPPISTGPSVSTAQYISTCCRSGRTRCTRNSRLSEMSIVSHQHHCRDDEQAHADRRQAPGVLGKRRDLVRDRVDAARVGQEVLQQEDLQRAMVSSNTGKAVATASATVNSGTSDSSVVYVRAPAVCRARSS